MYGSSDKQGQSLLALVILIGGIILVAGTALAVVTASFVDSSYGFQSSQQAQSVATAGVEDALLQLARNNQFANTGGYSIAVGSSTATVTVTQSSPSAGFATILSQATISLRVKKLQVVVSINTITGQTSIVSWTAVQ